MYYYGSKSKVGHEWETITMFQCHNRELHVSVNLSTKYQKATNNITWKTWKILKILIETQDIMHNETKGET